MKSWLKKLFIKQRSERKKDYIYVQRMLGKQREKEREKKESCELTERKSDE